MAIRHSRYRPARIGSPFSSFSINSITSLIIFAPFNLARDDLYTANELRHPTYQHFVANEDTFRLWHLLQEFLQHLYLALQDCYFLFVGGWSEDGSLLRDLLKGEGLSQ